MEQSEDDAVKSEQKQQMKQVAKAAENKLNIWIELFKDPAKRVSD